MGYQDFRESRRLSSSTLDGTFDLAGAEVRRVLQARRLRERSDAYPMVKVLLIDGASVCLVFSPASQAEAVDGLLFELPAMRSVADAQGAHYGVLRIQPAGKQ